mgnify:CR=1 FL=1
MKRGITYIALAYLWSWSWWIPLALSGAVTRPGQAWPTHLPGLLGPAVAAILTAGYYDGISGVRALWNRIARVRVHWAWYVIIAVTASMIALPFALGSDVEVADLTIYSGAGQLGLATVLYVLLLNGFGEEIGWRGYLADRMLEGHSLLDAAVRIWVVWGLWHLPLFLVVQNFRDLGVGGAIGWALGLLSGSIWLTWMYRESGASIAVVALWHTAFNFATATAAGAGVPAAVASTVVMIASVVIALRRSSRTLEPGSGPGVS